MENYEIALNRARKIYEKSESDLVRESIGKIFPELKESDTIEYSKVKIEKGNTYLCTKTHRYAGVKWVMGKCYYAKYDYALLNNGCTIFSGQSEREHNSLFKLMKQT